MNKKIKNRIIKNIKKAVKTNISFPLGNILISIAISINTKKNIMKLK